MDQIKSSLRVQIVTEEQELLRLAPAWDALYARAHKPFVSQSFEWTWCVWKKLGGSGRLHSVFIWDQDRLVLVWPVILVRYHRFWTIEVPIATAGDYIDFLVETSPEAEVFAKKAWQNRSRKADLTVIGQVRVSSLLHQVITSQKAVPEQRQPARFLEWDQFKDWTSYYRSLSERQDIERRRRRLLERGNISFKVVDDIDEFRNLSEWVLRHKAVWLSTRGGESVWVGSKSYENFLMAIPAELKTFGYMAAFALRSEEERTIAVRICVVGTSRIIMLHSADDQEFRQFSPLHILTVHVLEWAYERNLTVDFCYGAEQHKVAFGRGNCPVEDYRIPNSRFGKLHEFIRAKKGTKTAGHLTRLIRQLSPLR